MNAEKLKRLQAQVRIGGKGTPRRKKKVTHQTAATDDKKLQSSLKKLSVSTIPGIEEVNIIKDDLTVIHFNNPKAQASLSANTFAVTGHGETKKVVEMLPEILPQLGQETVVQLRMFANSMTSGQNQKQKQTNLILEDVADDVPLLVEDFDEIAKQESSVEFTAKPNTKTKNKSKETTENQPKQEKKPKPDQTPYLKEPKIDNILNADAENTAPNNEAKMQSIDQTPQENQTEKLKEKQIKKNKKSDIENLEKNKDTPKQELQTPPNKQMSPSLKNKEQNKENKKNTQSLAGNKNEQRPDDKKDVQTPITTKGGSKNIAQKESQQSNKNQKNQQVISNKNKQPDIEHKETQQPKKSQNDQQKLIENNQASIKEIVPVKETSLETAVIKEKEISIVPKDNLNVEKPGQDVDKGNEEKSGALELKRPTEDVTKQDKNSTAQIENISEVALTHEIKQPSLETNASIKDLALPIPPIIPPQAIAPKLAPLVNEPKLDTMPPELKKEPDTGKPEVLKETNVANVIVKDKEENISSIETVPSATAAVESTQSTEKLIMVSPSKTNSELPKQEESNLKILPSESTVLPEAITENQASAVKATEKPKTSPQQRTPLVSKPQSNQKPVASTSKQPAPQQQKQTSDSKKSPTSTDNKKDNEAIKGKLAASKPQSGNSSSPVKSQPTQQQQAQKAASTAQSSNKPNEKQTAPPKSTTTSKSVLTPKKPGTVPSSNSKPGNPTVDNKNKTNLTANKSKTPTPQGSQKTGKPLPNTTIAAGVPQTKPAEKPASQPTVDTKAPTPLQLPANQ